MTSVFDEETRNLLTALIKEMGLISPVIVQEIDGEIVGVDGYHRCEDCIKLGDAPIDVAVIEGDMVDVLCRNLVMDRARGKHSPAQMVRLMGSLYTKYALDPDKIKERTGLPRDYIERLIKVSEAGPAVGEALELERIGVGKAFQIARLPMEIQREALVNYPSITKMSEDDVKAFVENTLREMELLKAAPPPSVDKAHRPPPVYHCEGCKDEIEPRYLRPVMLCPDCFGAVWKLARARFAPDVKVEDKPLPP